MNENPQQQQKLRIKGSFGNTTKPSVPAQTKATWGSQTAKETNRPPKIKEGALEGQSPR